LLSSVLLYSSSLIFYSPSCSYFFFTDTPPSHIYTLSLHDALPISITGAVSPLRRPSDRSAASCARARSGCGAGIRSSGAASATGDRKSTRLNSSHRTISYAVFCLKKKKTQKTTHHKTQHQKTHRHQ